MKRSTLILILSFTLITSNALSSSIVQANTAPTVSSEKASDYNSAYTSIFNTMKKGMNDAPTTGNVDLDFVTEMTPHHEGGINMAKAIIHFGTNPDVKKIAEHIVTSQEAQLPTMQNMKMLFEKESPSNPEDTAAYLKKYNEIKDNMFKQMESVPLTTNPDTTFLQQMIFHHEGAIGMAKDILAYTKNPELIKLAKNIVKTQSQGVREMKKLLKKLS